MLWRLLLIVICAAPSASAKSLLLKPERNLEWRNHVAELRPGDEIQIDQHRFLLGRELGTGDYGRVFQTTYEAKRVAIKLQSDPRAVEHKPDHQVEKQAAQFEQFAEKNIPVPKCHLSPPNRPYLVMELVGDLNWVEKAATTESTNEKLQALEPVLDLLVKFDTSKVMPKDRRNLARNIVLSPANTYVLVDPGGVATVPEHVGFPMEMALQTLRRHEVAFANLVLFERLMRAGHYTRAIPQVLLSRSAIHQERLDPLWVIAYVLWAREGHHFTQKEFTIGFRERFKSSHPALVMTSQIEWNLVAPEDHLIAQEWMATERAALYQLLHREYANREATFRARLFAFHPWQEDLEFMSLTFGGLSLVEKQEALDTLSFSKRTTSISALAPLFCAADIAWP